MFHHHHHHRRANICQEEEGGGAEEAGLPISPSTIQKARARKSPQVIHANVARKKRERKASFLDTRAHKPAGEEEEVEVEGSRSGDSPALLPGLLQLNLFFPIP